MRSITELNAVSDEEFVAALGGIYEHSDWVPRRITAMRPFDTPEYLRIAMFSTVEDATDAEKLALIRAHPDLAGKLARAGALTDSSRREQAGLGLDRLSDEEYDAFTANNTAYREKFGFPFIICARLTTKQGVLDAFTERLQNPPETEIAEAITQIHEIARLRLEDSVTSE